MITLHRPFLGSILALTLTGLSGTGLVGGVPRSGARAPSADPASFRGPAAPPASGFHLGTAAGPFGWSSAVADFDEDGQPDFTVADRISARTPGRYGYRILFAVTGHTAQSVSFESPAAAVTIALQDVDDDQDLDVLVTETPSRIVDAVWLNDGRGRFVESPFRPPRGAWTSNTTLSGTDDVGSPALTAPERGVGAQPCHQATRHLPSADAVRTRDDRCAAPSVRSARSSRAPPSV